MIQYITEDSNVEKATVNGNRFGNSSRHIPTKEELEPFETFINEFKKDLRSELSAISTIIW